MTEWRDIPGYGGRYQVSSIGQVRSLHRKKERLLRIQNHVNGYKQITLRTADGGYVTPRVHQLVAVAFLGPKPSPDHEVCHNDGTRTNNVVENLRWGTRWENAQDKRLHGTNNMMKTRCKWGHEFNEENTRIITRRGGGTERQCRPCDRARWAAKRSAA